VAGKLFEGSSRRIIATLLVLGTLSPKMESLVKVRAFLITLRLRNGGHDKIEKIALLDFDMAT